MKCIKSKFVLLALYIKSSNNILKCCAYINNFYNMLILITIIFSYIICYISNNG